MRYVVIGPGAVGGTIGGRLAQHGHEVVFVARGAHGEALRERGLRLVDPQGTAEVRVPTVADPTAVDWRDDDVAVLAMKTQDTEAALNAMARSAAPSTAIVCAQNGVENERLAARRFANVYGMCVMLPATHLEPGVVEANSAPVSGILDLGRYPRATDATAKQIAVDLSSSQFVSEPSETIMRSKYAKLLMNLGNALQAACGTEARGGDLYRRARHEAEAVFRAAGIEYATQEEDRARRGDILKMAPIAGRARSGGSSWQSLARGTGSIESDFLNGEIVLLGRLHGVPTPVNAVLQRVANDLAARRGAPGSVPLAEVERLVEAESAG